MPPTMGIPARFPMRTRRHPAGFLCRSDGMVYIPASGIHPAHWTFGWPRGNGYLYLQYRGITYSAHRLVCEAFHGRPGKGQEVDHINHDRADNRPCNLRWVTHTTNLLNHGVPADRAVTERERVNFNRRYQEDGGFRVRHQARCREYSYAYYKQKHAAGFVHRKCEDGHWRWIKRKKTSSKRKNAK